MIHQYKLGGYNIVLDVCSGSVHVVDDAAYDIIADFEENPRAALIDSLEQGYAAKGVTRQELEECYDQVLSLKEQGKLFAPDVFESRPAPSRRAAAASSRRCASTWRTPAI